MPTATATQTTNPKLKKAIHTLRTKVHATGDPGLKQALDDCLELLNLSPEDMN
jgi:hypothetical protein